MDAIDKFFSALTSRELAVSIWILIAIIWCVSNSKARSSFFKLIKAIFAWKLSLSYILLFSYMAFIILILKAISIWKIEHIQLTVLWCICVAFVMLFDFQRANDQNFFKNSVKNNFKGLVFVEFIVNLYIFNFWIEFIIVPISAIIFGLKALTERNKEYEIIDKFIDRLLILAGLFILFYTSYKVFTDFSNFATIQNLESFYLPILFSILFLPFVYLAALIAAYEALFIRLRFFVADKAVLRYAKIKTILSIQLNLSKLNRWSDYIVKNWRFKNTKEVEEAVTAFKKFTAASSSNKKSVI